MRIRLTELQQDSNIGGKIFENYRPVNDEATDSSPVEGKTGERAEVVESARLGSDGGGGRETHAADDG